MAGRRGGRRGPRRQCAALAFAEQGGEVRVLLVTSRETRRWVLPKGWTEKGLSGHALAAKEAYEEAGVVGQASPDPVGQYGYLKRLSKGRSVECDVLVFPVRVERLLDDWPERGQRTRQWFTLAQAAMAVDEGDLAILLTRLAAPTAARG